MTLSTTSPGDEREREAFEAYYAKFGRVMGSGRFVQYIDPDDETLTHYVEPLVGEAWHIWQAARASSSTVQQVGADALDAARYRWLRSYPNNVNAAVYGPTGGLLRRDDYLDAAIDAAIASSPKSEQGDQQ